MPVSSMTKASEEASPEIDLCASRDKLCAISEDEEAEKINVTSQFWPSSSATSEIVEVPEATGTTLAADRDDSNDVYVAVGNKQSSYDVLRWALREAAIPGCSVFLVHIFPPITVIPTPLGGKMGREHVAPALVEAFAKEEESKRGEMIQKYMNLCHKSQVRAETMLVESEMVAETIVRLLEVGMVKKLVMGTTRSRLRKGNGKAEYVHRHAPKSCDVKIIYNGEEVVTDARSTPPVSPPPPPSKDGDGDVDTRDEEKKDAYQTCKCFPTLI